MKLTGLVTDEEIVDITEGQVFEWVRTGHWSKGEFMRWVLATQAYEFTLGVESVKYRPIGE